MTMSPIGSVSTTPGAGQRAGSVTPLDRSRASALWLAAVACLILAMVVVGGATRATGSGLSITQWKPVSGVLPPLTRGSWEHLFHLYQATPQYRLLNRNMTSAEFRTIFWWEWSHRLLGRLVGVAFAVPFVLLLALRKLPSRLTWRCVLLFLLGATQGAVGWWMVESGLEARTSVAPERLATHLGLALLLFSATIWTALESWFGPRRFASLRSPVWAWASSVLLSGVLLQCLLGALVAGNHAGLIDEDWPLMGGQILPDDYWKSGVWVTLAHGASAVQFNHRLLAYALLAGSLAMAISTFLARASTIRPLVIAICLLMLFQVILGVSTLVLTVPIGLSLLHQLTAVILLAATTMLAWQGRRV